MYKYKLAILASHPIQYQAPFFKEIAKNPEIDPVRSKKHLVSADFSNEKNRASNGVDLTVYFNWNFGIGEESFDEGFGKKIKWDIPVLEGYKYKFLKNFSLKPSGGFFGQINPGIVKELIINNYDAVVVFGWNSFTNWLVFFAAFLTRTPIFLRGESPLNQESAEGFKKIIKNLVLRFLFKITSAFLYIGEENKKFYRFYGAPDEKLFFAPYAVDNERFISKSLEIKNQKSKIKNELGINSKDIVILFVGKLIEKKRPMDLLKAFSMLGTSDVPNIDGNVRTLDVHLLFVGDGALRSELENYVKKYNLQNVSFVGFKNQTELPQYYAMADIFVLPSQWGETWGLVVNEAMCFSLPVIVSDIVGCGKDLVKSEENGYIFPLGNIEKLSEYLKELAENSKKRELFGKKSFEIIQNYSYEKDIEGILKALKIAN